MQIEPTTHSLRGLLDRLIDYAGLFPPASLDLDTSARYFARYLRGPNRWMLRSFVCPAARLHELADLFHELQPPRGVCLTALGPPPGSCSWTEGVDLAIQAADRFDETAGSTGAVVDSFELKLDATTGARAEDLSGACATLVARAAARRPADYFVEIVPAASDPAHAAAVFAAAGVALRPRHLGLKIRTGGVTPRDIPAAAAVAKFICACRDHGVPFKATAGLHHPLHHHSEEVGADMHGFLNVFCGSILAAAHGLDEDWLADFLVESDGSKIRWSDDGFGVEGHAVSVDEIRRIRQTLAVSFGSCSFDEPREDLLRLHLASPVT